MLVVQKGSFEGRAEGISLKNGRVEGRNQDPTEGGRGLSGYQDNKGGGEGEVDRKSRKGLATGSRRGGRDPGAPRYWTYWKTKVTQERCWVFKTAKFGMIKEGALRWYFSFPFLSFCRRPWSMVEDTLSRRAQTHNLDNNLIN